MDECGRKRRERDKDDQKNIGRDENGTKHREKDENDKKCTARYVEYDKTHKDRDDDDKKVKDRDDYEKKLGDSDGEEDRKRRMLMTVTLEAGTTMVALEARVMMKTGNASSSKGFKLSQTHQSQITMEHR